MQEPHALEPQDVELALETGPRGLASTEALTRLRKVGPNRIADARPPSILRLLLGQFRSPLIYLLLVAAVVSLASNERSDAAVILFVVALNAGIGFFQERRAERSVRSLARMVHVSATVVRDGRAQTLDAHGLVPGDLVIVEAGSRIPADLRLVQAHEFEVDESTLTGESTGVVKTVSALPSETPLADRANCAFMGSSALRGFGAGYVVATGEKTQIGHIAAQVRTTDRAETPLQKKMAQFGKTVGLIVAGVAALAMALGVLHGEPVREMFLIAVALAVAAIPEGLPVATTITLALGVRRMAKRNAIVRRLAAVEALGSTTVICSDKTGTLTENRMSVEEIWIPNGSSEAEVLGDTLAAAVLTSTAAIHENEATGDPTEVALLRFTEDRGVHPDTIRHEWQIASTQPFDSERQTSAALAIRDGLSLLFIKGAPERIIDRCVTSGNSEKANALDADSAYRAAADLARRGLRVIALAVRAADSLDQSSGLTLLSLVGMRDPPREGVREAIAACRGAGVRVMMLTGDHPETARQIAVDLGLAGPESEVLAGSQISILNHDELAKAVTSIDVYARVAPDQKLRIVKALRRHGHIVAVTGDGVNDAPALKAADIGVAMGRSGTDVAREAAEIVLTDDNFATILAAVEEGRTTFSNLRKVAFYLVSSNAAEVLSIVAALALGWPLLLLPAQILWLNLVSEGVQDIALAFEPGEKELLRRPPRRQLEGIISPVLWERTVLVGLLMAAGTLFLFDRSLATGSSVTEARSVALTALVMFQVLHVGNARAEHASVFSRPPWLNPSLVFGTVAALILHTAALYVVPAQALLRVTAIDARHWLEIILVSFSVVVVVELHKWLRRPASSRVSRAARR